MRKHVLPIRGCTLISLFLLFSGVLSSPVDAGEVRVAVASNFADAMRDIARQFEEDSGHDVTLVVGSTGKHYAQIRNGAPFDVFFAADVHRPALLDSAGACVPGTRFTYARGRLVLWSSQAGYVDDAGSVLETDFRNLAIANPDLAPYGKAARETLEARRLWDGLEGRIVRGENVGQAFALVKSGGAALGFVAYAQIGGPGTAEDGSFWEVPDSMYAPIEQQAVLLRNTPQARAFFAFVAGDRARRIIEAYGYIVPAKE